MKKIFLLFILALGMSYLGWGQAILYEDFNYTPPAYIGGIGNAGSSSNNWTTHSVTSGQTTTIDVVDGNLLYPGLFPPNGYKVSMFGNGNLTSRDVNRAITSTSNVLYFSVLLNVLDNSGINATGDYFMHFGSTAGSSAGFFGGRLGAKSVNSGVNFRFMIQNTSSGTPTFTEFAQDLSFGTTYLVVVKYDKSTSPTTASLWVNPSSLGGTEPTGAVTNSSGTGTFATFASICLRNNATTPKVAIDEIRIGPAWADVTPTGGASAPLIQAYNITFSGIQQTQMDVSWSNGDGAKRVVKINTSNSFTAPADGTDPIANPVYGGSGDQVVYNGSGSSVTVTGLTAGSTYWFRVYEYNGTGTGTVYCTATGVNNPNSQSTSSVATPPAITDPTVTNITTNSALLGGNITSDGGASITERGTVWKTSSGVTISDNKLAEGGTTTGVFTHTRSSLPSNSVIYYAAYATNSAGTTLTTESSFTTLALEPTNHASAFVASSTVFSSVTVTWLDNDGTQPASGFLILANTTGLFTDPVDGIPQTDDPILADGSGVKNIAHGIQTYNWTGLAPLTPYYFTIYSYTNSGTNIDYKITPAAPTANVTTPAYADPLAAWTFDNTPANPNTPGSITANVGTQLTATFYADSTNGSSMWHSYASNPELTAFTGTTLNDPRVTPVSGNAIALANSSANNKSIVFKFSMTGYQDPLLTFATRGTATGFNTHQWAWSTDNITYTDFGTNTANISSTFLLRTLDMSSIDALDQAATVYLRLTLSGATSATGNNRLDNVVLNATPASISHNLNLKIYLEGLYNTTSGEMNQAQGTSGAQFGAGIADQVTVELHNALDYTIIEYTTGLVDLSTSGNITISTIPASYSGSYYITIKHRNSIETTTLLPVSFAASTISYDFSTAASQAYGSNMKPMGTDYVIYGGDATQDGIVDGSDMAAIDNASTVLLVGYNPEDINGDGIVDGSDMALIDNNSTAIVHAQTP